MACYMNSHIKDGVIRIYSILSFLILLVLNNNIFAQNIEGDTLCFYKAQEKLDNCKSGIINYKLNYVTSNFELYWDVEFYFIRNNNKLFFYVKQIEDTMVSEYVFYNDTILIFAEYDNNTTYFKEYTNNPFNGNIRRVFTYLLDEHNLTNFISYDQVKLFDTISPPSNDSIIIGLASESTKANGLDGYYNSKIVLNKNNFNLISCFNEVVAYKDSSLFHKSYKEYVIDTISLYYDKNQDIAFLISSKYDELNKIIMPYLAFEKEVNIESTKEEIPKYAYEWRLPQVNGDTLYSDSINSKILVVDFYYMSCAPCILAINDLIKLDSLYNENEVTFIGANVVDNDISKINTFLQKKNVKYRNIVNAKSLSDKYGFHSFPQILFIDTETNEILYHFSGYRSDEFEYYKDILRKLLDER